MPASDKSLPDRSDVQDFSAHDGPTPSVETPSGERRRLVIIMLEQQAALSEIEAATGYRPRTIREIAQRYRQYGPSALVDQRVHSRGAKPLLTAEQQHELCMLLQTPPTDGGSWNGPKVAQWIAAKIGRHVHRQRGWDYLRRLQSSAAPLHAERSVGQTPAQTDD